MTGIYTLYGLLCIKAHLGINCFFVGNNFVKSTKTTIIIRSDTLINNEQSWELPGLQKKYCSWKASTAGDFNQPGLGAPVYLDSGTADDSSNINLSIHETYFHKVLVIWFYRRAPVKRSAPFLQQINPFSDYYHRLTQKCNTLQYRYKFASLPYIN
jgi:hypothetical protein